MAWVRSADPEREVPHWGWLVAWAAVLIALSFPEFSAFRRAGQGGGARLDQELLVRGRSIVAYAMRYLTMAATSSGLAPFHQPEPAESWCDPWWLGGVIALVLLGWRTGLTLVKRREEAAWWVMAAASFAPISQIFPFVYPIADRYLYTILPGLLGGALLAWQAGAPQVECRLRVVLGKHAPKFSLARAGAVAALLGLTLAFAPRAHHRTYVFLSEGTIAAESARKYPDGIQAWIRRAEHQARMGDAAAVAVSLEEIDRRGFDGYTSLAGRLDPVRSDPRVGAVLDRMALRRVDRVRALARPYPLELMALAQAQIHLGQLPAAVESLERAIEIGAPNDAEIRVAIRRAKSQMARQERRSPSTAE
jgi:hypothetical protein